MAVCVTFLMVLLTISAISFANAPEAKAAGCTVSTAVNAVDATTVNCPTDWRSGINIDLGSDSDDKDGCSGVRCEPTPVVNTNINVFVGTLPCLYLGTSEAKKYEYPVNRPRTCQPQSPYSICGAFTATRNANGDSCTAPLTCPPQGGKSALKMIVSNVTQKVFKNGKQTRVVQTIRGYCVFPNEPPTITEKHTNASTSGYCAVNGKETLWRSDSASTIRSGATGSVSPSGVSSQGTEGSGTAGISRTFNAGLDKSSAARLVATCKQGVFDWNAPLPKDTVRGGSILGYYRLTAKTNYQRCYIQSFAPIFQIEPKVVCETGTTPVYEHNRFTNTCRYGVVEGVHTEYAKYFDPSTCDSSWVCHFNKTKIAGQSNDVDLTRNGANVSVNYGPFSVTGNNVTPDKTSYKRMSSVVDGSTPFHGSDASVNDNNQYFRMFADGTGTYPAGTQVKFDQYILLSKLGTSNRTNVQFYWASDSKAPWHIVTKYKFSGIFQVAESFRLDGGVNLVDVQDDATCPDSADSANANVLRSVNTK